MSGQPELGDIARAVIDANLYMTLGTAGEDGRPWVTPVYYSVGDYAEFYWVSSPEATHSRNIAARPEVSIVIFDSQAAIGTAQAVYMAGVAEELTGADRDRGIEIFSRGSQARGAGRWTSDRVQAPAHLRLYRATVSEHSILCPRTYPEPCPIHGRTDDHRIAVPLREIAEAVGVSHQRVHQIVGDESAGTRVRRAVAKRARAGGVGIVLLVVGAWWGVANSPLQSRADAITELEGARSYLSSHLPDDARGIIPKLDRMVERAER